MMNLNTAIKHLEQDSSAWLSTVRVATRRDDDSLAIWRDDKFEYWNLKSSFKVTVHCSRVASRRDDEFE